MPAIPGRALRFRLIGPLYYYLLAVGWGPEDQRRALRRLRGHSPNYHAKLSFSQVPYRPGRTIPGMESLPSDHPG